MALIFLTLFVVGGCEVEVDMTLKVSGGNPPTFSYSGSGKLGFFRVREASWDELKLTPAQRSEDKLIVWEIWPDSPDTRIRNLPEITYGQIPPGFRQTIPDHGGPPPLAEGKLYRAGGPAPDARGGVLYFTIRKGRAVDALEAY